MLELGAVNPAKYAEAKKSGEALPGPHSPYFAPDREPSLKTGIEAERQAMGLLYATEDRKEGLGAFLERREAKFGGR